MGIIRQVRSSAAGWILARDERVARIAGAAMLLSTPYIAVRYPRAVRGVIVDGWRALRKGVVW